MKALVTGGAGFIGSNLVQLLLANDFQVRVFDNLSTGYFKNIQDLKVEFVQGDILDADLVETVVEDVDVVFHLAAHIGNVKSLNAPKEDAQINIFGALNLLEAARKKHVKKIVYSSSAATFGELVHIPIDESHPQEPDSPYGVSKLAAEKYMMVYGRIYGITVVCLRYFNVYGLNQRYDSYGNVIPIFAHRIYTKQPMIIYGDGEQTRDFVNVKDVARANMLAGLNCNQTDIYNLGSGASITINQLAGMMREVSGEEQFPIEYAAPRPGEVRHCRADISKAQMAFGFSPDQDMNAGLQEYYDWFAAEKSAEK